MVAAGRYAASCCLVVGPNRRHRDFLEAKRMSGVQVRSLEGTVEQGPDMVGKPYPKRGVRTVLRGEGGCPDRRPSPQT